MSEIVRGGGMQQLLLDLMEYRVVLGAVATTLDGLLVAHAGLLPEDAEIVSAASSSQGDDSDYSTSETRGGILHILRGRDMRLIILTESSAPQDAISSIMQGQLERLENALAV